jgi:acetoin:2,6-dichlorophenolindophenol oxidoreductase subunit beta
MKTHEITFCEAIKEALDQEMERDSNIFIYGIGVSDHKAIFGSVAGLADKYGLKRCLETPLCEDSLAGFGLGAAINGLRPIYIHIRADFLLLAMNQLANMISNWNYISGGKLKVPLVIRVVIGRGWGQGCQHSKSMQSIYAHIPGLKVVMPTTPMDMKGLLISAIRDDNPVIIMEHRWLYWQKGTVPIGPYTVPIGEPNLLREGKDITVAATSWMNIEAMKAAEILHRRGVELEIIDIRTITHFNDSIIIESVKKTGNCIVADNDWSYCGFNAEVTSNIYSKCLGYLSNPIERIGFEHVPCPTARCLENKFYPNAVSIIRSVEKLLDLSKTDTSQDDFYSHENRFKGPF